VRRSWADPLGWAGLQKVPPHEEDHLAVLEAHVTELAAELAKVDDAIAAERLALWELAAQVRSPNGHADLTSSLAQRRAELAARERALLVTAGERARLATEI
jgi:hypothetical protein